MTVLWRIAAFLPPGFWSLALVPSSSIFVAQVYLPVSSRVPRELVEAVALMVRMLQLESATSVSSCATTRRVSAMLALSCSPKVLCIRLLAMKTVAKCNIRQAQLADAISASPHM